MDFISWTYESFIPYSYEINLAATGSALTVVPHYQYEPDCDPKALRVSVHICIVHHVFDCRNSNRGIVLNVLKLECNTCVIERIDYLQWPTMILCSYSNKSRVHIPLALVVKCMRL